MAKHRFVLLDGLRGIAAVGVVLTHIAARYFPVLSGLYLLVDFFFVLSGFVLEPLMPHADEPLQPQAKKFIYKRFLRFVPMALVVVLFRAGTCATWSVLNRPSGNFCAGTGSTDYTLSLVSAVLLLQIVVHSSLVFSGALWSLSAEWFSNLVVTPLTAMKNRFVLPAALVCGQVLLIVGYLHDKSFGALFSGYPALGRALVGFVLGILIRRLYDKRQAKPSRFLMLLSCVLVMGLFMYQRTPYQGALLLAPPVFAFFVFQAARAEALVLRPHIKQTAAYLGLMSFGVYAWHENMRFLVAAFQSDAVLDSQATQTAGSTLGKFVLVLMASVLATHLTIRYVEKPIQRRWGNRYSRRSDISATDGKM